VNIEDRLAFLFAELQTLGVRTLVMGGHAVRFYGVGRNTVDFDVHVALSHEQWERLGETLRSSAMAGPSFHEGTSWRPKDFRRFVLGALPDGREERLEFWRQNHLLAPFEDLWERREEGTYGGGQVAFLGLDDLIHSKETEREDDWTDVRLLEEIADQRRLQAEGKDSRVMALARLRSRKGFTSALARGLLADEETVASAAALAASPLACAFLAPYRPKGEFPSMSPAPDALRQLVDGPLRRVEPGSARHAALVEAARRLYQQAAMAADRADKQRQARSGDG
jgi:hypothetical protein